MVVPARVAGAVEEGARAGELADVHDLSVGQVRRAQPLRVLQVHRLRQHDRVLVEVDALDGGRVLVHVAGLVRVERVVALAPPAVDDRLLDRGIRHVDVGHVVRPLAVERRDRLAERVGRRHLGVLAERLLRPVVGGRVQHSDHGELLALARLEGDLALQARAHAGESLSLEAERHARPRRVAQPVVRPAGEGARAHELVVVFARRAREGRRRIEREGDGGVARVVEVQGRDCDVVVGDELRQRSVDSRVADAVARFRVAGRVEPLVADLGDLVIGHRDRVEVAEVVRATGVRVSGEAHRGEVRVGSAAHVQRASAGLQNVVARRPGDTEDPVEVVVGSAGLEIRVENAFVHVSCGIWNAVVERGFDRFDAGEYRIADIDAVGLPVGVDTDVRLESGNGVGRGRTPRLHEHDGRQGCSRTSRDAGSQGFLAHVTSSVRLDRGVIAAPVFLCLTCTLLNELKLPQAFSDFSEKGVRNDGDLGRRNRGRESCGPGPTRWARAP